MPECEQQKMKALVIEAIEQILSSTQVPQVGGFKNDMKVQKFVAPVLVTRVTTQMRLWSVMAVVWQYMKPAMVSRCVLIFKWNVDFTVQCSVCVAVGLG